MNEEIKEILELFAFTDENIMFCDIVELNSKQSHLLLDYITNLQQKYEIAQKDIQSLKNNYNDLIKMSENKIENLQQENEKLKYNARGQVNDYFKDKYADEVLKNAELQQDLDKANDIIEKDRQFYKCRMDEYVDLKKEHEILQEFKHYFTHEVKKLDNMTDENYIKAVIDSIKNLQKANEDLKQTLHNISINGVEEENTTVLDLINENKRLKEEKQRLLYNLEKVCEERDEEE